MKQISVAKPDMAVLGQDRLGLSPFGLLSRLFERELARRVHQEEGDWRRLPLTLLEDEAAEDERQPAPAPVIQLNLDLKILMKAIRKAREQQAGKDALDKQATPGQTGRPEKKDAPATLEQRVLERVILMERERRVREDGVRHVLIHNGTRGWEPFTPGRQRQTVTSANWPALQGKSVPLHAAIPLPAGFRKILSGDEASVYGFGENVPARYGIGAEPAGAAVPVPAKPERGIQGHNDLFSADIQRLFSENHNPLQHDLFVNFPALRSISSRISDSTPFYAPIHTDRGAGSANAYAGSGGVLAQAPYGLTTRSPSERHEPRPSDGAVPAAWVPPRENGTRERSSGDQTLHSIETAIARRMGVLGTLSRFLSVSPGPGHGQSGEIVPTVGNKTRMQDRAASFPNAEHVSVGFPDGASLGTLVHADRAAGDEKASGRDGSAAAQVIERAALLQPVQFRPAFSAQSEPAAHSLTRALEPAARALSARPAGPKDGAREVASRPTALLVDPRADGTPAEARNGSFEVFRSDNPATVRETRRKTGYDMDKVSSERLRTPWTLSHDTADTNSLRTGRRIWNPSNDPLPGGIRAAGLQAAAQEGVSGARDRLGIVSHDMNFITGRRSGTAEYGAVQEPARMLLASQAASVPSAEGWTPQWQQVHPGYPSRDGRNNAEHSPAGSILLPDLIRYRKESAASGIAAPRSSRLPALLRDALDRAAARETEAEPKRADRDSGESRTRHLQEWNSVPETQRTSETAPLRERYGQSELRGLTETSKMLRASRGGILPEAENARDIPILHGATGPDVAEELELAYREQRQPDPYATPAETRKVTPGPGEAAREVKSGATADMKAVRGLPVSADINPLFNTKELSNREQRQPIAQAAPSETQRVVVKHENIAHDVKLEAVPETETVQGVPVPSGISQPPTVAELEYREQTRREPYAAPTEIRSVTAGPGEAAREAKPNAAPATETTQGVPVPSGIRQPSTAAELAYREPHQPDPYAAPSDMRRTAAELEKTAREVTAAEGVPIPSGISQPPSTAELAYREPQQPDPYAAPAETRSVTAEPLEAAREAKSGAAPETVAAAQGVPIPSGISQPPTTVELAYREQRQLEPYAAPTEIRSVTAGPGEAAREAKPSAAPETAAAQGVPVPSGIRQPPTAAELAYREQRQPEPYAAPSEMRSVTAEPGEAAREAKPSAALETAAAQGVPIPSGIGQPLTTAELAYREPTQPAPYAEPSDLRRTTPGPREAEQGARPNAAPETETAQGVPVPSGIGQPLTTAELEYREQTRRDPYAAPSETRRTTSGPREAEQGARPNAAPETATVQGVPVLSGIGQPPTAAELAYREQQQPDPYAAPTEIRSVTPGPGEAARETNPSAAPDTATVQGIPVPSDIRQPPTAAELAYREMERPTPYVTPTEMQRTAAEPRETAQGIPVPPGIGQAPITTELAYREMEQPAPYAAPAETRSVTAEPGEAAQEPKLRTTLETVAAAQGIPVPSGISQPPTAAELAYREPKQPDPYMTHDETRSAAAELEETAQGVPVPSAISQPPTAAELAYREQRQPDPYATPSDLRRTTVEPRGASPSAAPETETAQGVPVPSDIRQPPTAAELAYREQQQPDPYAAPSDMRRTTAEPEKAVRETKPSAALETAAAQGVPVPSGIGQPLTTAELAYREQQQPHPYAASSETRSVTPGPGEAAREAKSGAAPDTAAVQGVPVPSDLRQPLSTAELAYREQQNPWADDVSAESGTKVTETREKANLPFQLPKTAARSVRTEPGRDHTILSAIPLRSGRTTGSGEMNLTYAHIPQSRPETPVAKAESASAANGTPADGIPPNGLPAWARRVLDQTQGKPFGSQSGAPFRYNAAAVGQHTGNSENQISWTAPYARTAAPSGSTPAVPTQMVFRQRGEDGAAEPWPRRKEFDERDARKMADKVYQIIEERLRKELRRGGK